MFLTTIFLSIVIGVVGGIVCGIFFPESEEEKQRRKRKEKKSFWWHMWHDSNFRSSGYYYWMFKKNDKNEGYRNGSSPFFFPNPGDGTTQHQSESRQQHGIDMAESCEITRHKHRNPNANHRNPQQPIKRFFEPIHRQNPHFFSQKPSKTAKKPIFRCKIKKKIWSVEEKVVILHRFFKNYIIN